MDDASTNWGLTITAVKVILFGERLTAFAPIKEFPPSLPALGPKGMKT
jgi:hypothetical protein